MSRKLICAALLMGALAGCAAGGGAGSVPVATGTTFEQQLVSAAGLGDFSQVPTEKASRDGANLSAAALTGLTTASPVGGMTSLSSLGMGALMFLATPPKSAASYPQMIVLAPAGKSTEAVQVELQRKLVAGLAPAVEAAGFKPVQLPAFNGQTAWLKDGCDQDASLRGSHPECLQFYSVQLTPQGRLGDKQVYAGINGGSDMFQSVTLLPPRDGNGYDTRSSLKAISKAPGQLYLYVPPIETAEGWSEPFVVGPSGAKPLVR